MSAYPGMLLFGHDQLRDCSGSLNWSRGMPNQIALNVLPDSVKQWTVAIKEAFVDSQNHTRITRCPFVRAMQFLLFWAVRCFLVNLVLHLFHLPINDLFYYLHDGIKQRMTIHEKIGFLGCYTKFA